MRQKRPESVLSSLPRRKKAAPFRFRGFLTKPRKPHICSLLPPFLHASCGTSSDLLTADLNGPKEAVFSRSLWISSIQGIRATCSRWQKTHTNTSFRDAKNEIRKGLTNAGSCAYNRSGRRDVTSSFFTKKYGRLL